MRQETILFILGILTLVTPLAGVPNVWKDGVHVFLGACIILSAVVYRMDARRRERSQSGMAHEEYNPNIETQEQSEAAM